MVLIKADVPQELDVAFREKVLEKFGFRRGALSEALIEAIKNWIDNTTIDTSKSKKSPLPINDLLNEYSGKYLAIKDGKVEIVANNLSEFWSILPADTNASYTIITPRMREKRTKIGQLGWHVKKIAK